MANEARLWYSLSRMQLKFISERYILLYKQPYFARVMSHFGYAYIYINDHVKFLHCRDKVRIHGMRFAVSATPGRSQFTTIELVRA